MIKIYLGKGIYTQVSDEDACAAMTLWRLTGRYASQSVGPSNKRTTKHLHIVIWERMSGKPVPEGLTVDHKDRNSLNNQRDNLRLATRSQQNQNSAKRKGSSPYKGVHWCPDNRNWRVRIKLPDKRIEIGRFNSLESAKAAYDVAAEEYFGEFAKV